jgi:hypothetical protein
MTLTEGIRLRSREQTYGGRTGGMARAMLPYCSATYSLRGGSYLISPDCLSYRRALQTSVQAGGAFVLTLTPHLLHNPHSRTLPHADAPSAPPAEPWGQAKYCPCCGAPRVTWTYRDAEGTRVGPKKKRCPVCDRPIMDWDIEKNVPKRKKPNEIRSSKP